MSKNVRMDMKPRLPRHQSLLQRRRRLQLLGSIPTTAQWAQRLMLLIHRLASQHFHSHHNNIQCHMDSQHTRFRLLMVASLSCRLVRCFMEVTSDNLLLGITGSPSCLLWRGLRVCLQHLLSQSMGLQRSPRQQRLLLQLGRRGYDQLFSFSDRHATVFIEYAVDCLLYVLCRF